MFKKVYLEITNRCNLNCRFCPGTERQSEFMPPERFRILAGKIRPFSEYLYFHLMGEPTLHPDLGELLETASELGFRVIITTNGTLLRSKGEILLRSAAVHKVNISLQSFEANEKGVLEEYMTDCLSFAQNCSAAGKICVLRLWNGNGYDSLNSRILDMIGRTFPDMQTGGRKGIRLGERIWLEPGDMFDWPGLDRGDLGESCFCYGLRDQIGVLVDGTVVPCCLDHDGDIPLGNLLNGELEDILSSKRAEEIYRGFSGRKAVEELCRRCGYARRF